jgi:hypothetical protein
MHTSNYSHNRNYSNRISSSQHRQSNHPRLTGLSSISSNPEEIFQYKGSYKQQWAKLQNKIKQKMMSQNIWYLEDKDEVARRSTPAPPISTIPPLPSETPNQREDRLRLQKLYDDHRRKRESKFEDSKNSSPSTTERLLQYTITSYHQLYNWTSTEQSRK